ncbi:hypothetical protein EVA_08946, partial [gut metagenome]
MVFVSAKPVDGTDAVLTSANFSGLSKETIMTREMQSQNPTLME